jgi:hypothetical protein
VLELFLKHEIYKIVLATENKNDETLSDFCGGALFDVLKKCRMD